MRDTYSREQNKAQTTVHKWRAIPQTDIDALDSFLSWLMWDDDSPSISQEEADFIKPLVDKYLRRDPL